MNRVKETKNTAVFAVPEDSADDIAARNIYINKKVAEGHDKLKLTLEFL